jgi:hypothetical protein
MKRAILCLVLGSLVALPAQAQPQTDPAQIQKWTQEFRRPVIAPSPDGLYQLQRLGKRFLMVYDPSGAPVVAFDLSLTALSEVEMVLGGIGFGDLNLLKLIQLIQKLHQSEKDACSMEDAAPDQQPTSDAQISKMLNSGKGSDRDVAKVFKQIRLTDDWAVKNHAQKPDQKPGVPIPDSASFSLGDLQFPNVKARASFLKLFIPFMNKVDPAQYWDETNIQQALSEIQLRSSGKGEQYQVVWDRSTRLAAPALPGFVFDFQDPTANLQYKGSLMQLSDDLAGLHQIGPIGMVIEIVVSQMVMGVIERIEYHEHEFIGVLEAMERFDYPLDGFPPALLESTLSALYANTMFPTTDSDSSQDYVDVRVQTLTYQEKAKDAITAKLAKQLPPSDVVTLFGGNKFALVRNQKAGAHEPWSILSSAIKPNWLFGFATKHVDGRTPDLIWLERELVIMASAAARATLPIGFGFKVGTQTIGISIDPMVYELLIRTPMFHDKYLEGELAGLVDESIAGKLNLPLSTQELTYTKASLHKTLNNPYEIELSDEDTTIETNYILIQDQIGSGSFRVPHLP